MRNLPCRDALKKEMPWSVCGHMVDRLADGTVVRGSGVLEWCWDREDALDRMAMMVRDPRFSGLYVMPTKTEEEAEWDATTDVLEARHPFNSGE